MAPFTVMTNFSHLLKFFKFNDVKPSTLHLGGQFKVKGRSQNLINEKFIKNCTLKVISPRQGPERLNQFHHIEKPQFFLEP